MAGRVALCSHALVPLSKAHIMADKPGSGRRGAVAAPRLKQWSKCFLAELAGTSNVSAAARKAGISTATAYEARRQNAEFNRAWQRALCEGYDHLEMELLHRLRSGEVKPASNAKRGVRSFDNATALRLLAAHREAVSQQRAIRANEDAAVIIAAIDTKLERIRQRRLLQAPVATVEPASEDDQANG